MARNKDYFAVSQNEDSNEDELPLLSREEHAKNVLQSQGKNPDSLNDSTDRMTMPEANPNLLKQKSIWNRIASVFKDKSEDRAAVTKVPISENGTKEKPPRKEVPRPPQSEIDESLSILQALFPSSTNEDLIKWLRVNDWSVEETLKMLYDTHVTTEKLRRLRELDNQSQEEDEAKMDEESSESVRKTWRENLSKSIHHDQASRFFGDEERTATTTATTTTSPTTNSTTNSVANSSTRATTSSTNQDRFDSINNKSQNGSKELEQKLLGRMQELFPDKDKDELLMFLMTANYQFQDALDLVFQSVEAENKPKTKAHHHQIPVAARQTTNNSTTTTTAPSTSTIQQQTSNPTPATYVTTHQFRADLQASSPGSIPTTAPATQNNTTANKSKLFDQESWLLPSGTSVGDAEQLLSATGAPKCFAVFIEGDENHYVLSKNDNGRFRHFSIDKNSDKQYHVAGLSKKSFSTLQETINYLTNLDDGSSFSLKDSIPIGQVFSLH